MLQSVVEWVPEGLPIPDLSRIDPEKVSELLNNPRPRIGSVRVSVKDNGTGMTDQELQELFGEGVQFNPNNLQSGQGSGLGLFISKGIVEQHGGWIHAISEGLGYGSTFIMELPLFFITENSSVPNNTDRNNLTQRHDFDDIIEPFRFSSSHSENDLHETRGKQYQLSEDTCFVEKKSNIVLPDLDTTKAVGTYNVNDQAIKSISATNNDSNSSSKSRSFATLFNKQDKRVVPAELIPPTSTQPSSETKVCTNETTCAPIKTDVQKVRNVLMVDDSLPNRKMLGRILRMNDCKVTEAVDGQDAVNKMKDNMEALRGSGTGVDGDKVPFDFITMDFEMPIMKGPEATKLIRDMGYTGPIIGVSGNVLKEDVDYFMSCGATTVLPKPVDIKVLKSYWK